MPTSLHGPLLQALDALWGRIRSELPELPHAHIALSTKTPTSDHSHSRWGIGDDGYLTGLVISTQTLSAGAVATVEYFRHEAAHVLCWRRGISETTMRGIYHNARFRVIAEEAGLHWGDRPHVQGKGFHDPKMTPEVLARHAEDITALEEILPTVLPSLTPPPSSSSQRARRLMLTCECVPEPRKLWMARTVAELGPVSCEICGKRFEER
ncbi:hypothetical protein [Streptomyces scabiei]|uniref:hypothetical protein n=1 Tax=Streptomyces scabiei TaxID=1930 RepID=UPI0029B7888B|nr:hypothetical protein [Streptomyces scabiei]MDX2794013.1 hypothetical protein [Streptomyces scabiei]